LQDHSFQVVELIETYRELASDLTDLYMSTVSNRMNEVMKVLTVIATIFIPLTFIVGVYGMNFDTEISPWNMPELKAYYGYPICLTAMAVLAIGLLAFFRKKGWIGRQVLPTRREHAASSDR
jgi:magnesium transporter